MATATKKTTTKKTAIVNPAVVAGLNPAVVNEVVRSLSLSDRAALANVAKPKNSDLAPGIYPVDVTVRIRGTVRKGEDFKATQPASLNPWALCGFLLSKLNATTADAVAAQVAEAFKSGTLNSDFDAYKKYAEEALATMAAATEITKSGMTTVAAAIEVVG
jgi:hypothetical protein